MMRRMIAGIDPVQKAERSQTAVSKLKFALSLKCRDLIPGTMSLDQIPFL